MNQVALTATYDKDTFRTHRYLINANEHGITGTIYVSKESEVPDKVTIDLAIKGEK